MANKNLQPFTIVGAGGRIGQALKEMGPGSDVLIKRGEKIAEGGSGPIIVWCVHLTMRWDAPHNISTFML